MHKKVKAKSEGYLLETVSNREACVQKQNYRKSFIYVFLILLIIIFIFSLILGRYPISIGTLCKVMLSRFYPVTRTWQKTIETVIFQVRIPRMCAAVLVGASLSVSGAAYQGMFKNPLVSPDILGVSAGAGFGAALGIFFSLNVVGIQFLSFLMGLIAVTLSFVLSSRSRHDPIVALVLVGMLVGTIFTSGTSLLKYMADPYDKLPAITFWLMGSLASIKTEDVKLALIPMLLGVVPIYLLRWRLNVLSFGDEEAKALGLDTKKIRLVVILCSTLMTASAVSISGMIGWVGLIVPHMARLVVGPNYKELIPASILLGSCYLLLVDDIARIASSVEIPLGILTSTIGAPFFLYLLLYKKVIR